MFAQCAGVIVLSNRSEPAENDRRDDIYDGISVDPNWNDIIYCYLKL